MSITTCPTCCRELDWNWEEAFDKFGFDDGDGIVMTEHVASILRDAGYYVTIEAWGMHNVVIVSICHDGTEQIPAACNLGYDNPRGYLPKPIIAILDAAFTSDTEVEP